MTLRHLPSVRAFVSPDLVGVLTGFALLALVGAPLAGRSRLRSEQALCSTHLRAVGQASTRFAHDNNEQFPSMNGGLWPWDMPAGAANRLIENGATRRDLYCPSVTQPDRNERWRFTSGSTNDLANPEVGFRVAGYQFAFAGAGRVQTTNLTESLRPKSWTINGVAVNPPLSDRVIVADAILSQGADEANRANNRFVGIDGGLGKHDSAHLTGGLPAGGNLLMADGHVDWRRFSKMRVRTVSSPSFWW